ncbi:MAG: type III pantothenate kinase [Candidatus Omnitrophica bacterium]|nr:type III pantothenate kinase [Candidatus Omnitrophota bacterium]
MKHLLAIDIGNTNITLGLFKGPRLVKRAKIATREYNLYGKRLKGFAGKGAKVVISSVAPKALAKIRKALAVLKCRQVLVLGSNVPVPIQNLYRIKRQVGQDRLVNAYAAKKLFGTPCVIIDLGTAVTFDIVSKKGAYLGGLILPGIAMALSGLHEKTALLPKVQLKAARSIIGKDTVSSIRGGILFSLGVTCDGLIARYRKLLGRDLKVVLTGGSCRLIRKYTSSVHTIDEDLTLKGLYLISKSA